jgi:glutamate synthase (NADPH/NADH) large chain
MTGGIAVVLGEVGANFGAGMSGGMAFVYDPANRFAARANPESISWQRLASRHWESVLLALIRAHQDATDSKWAGALLDDWDRVTGHFWQVVPNEMLGRLAYPLDDQREMAAAE